MLIRIISGTYGHRYNGRIVPKDRTSTPFELDDKEAKRIISLGIAEAVLNSVATPEKPQNTSGTNSNTFNYKNSSNSKIEGDTLVDGHLDAEQLEKMKISDLKMLAEDMGIDTSKMKVKSDYISAIVEIAVDVPLDDGEVPPHLSAEAPLV